MKKKLIILLIGIISICVNSFAQNTTQQSVPGGMLFQAIAKDAQNVAATNRDVYAIVSILKHDANGSIEFSEKFQVTSGNDGIFTLIIGKGSYFSGSKSNLFDIDWSADNYFLNIKIAVKPSIGSTLESSWLPDANYVDIGTSQLWTVPYSFYANNSKYSEGASKLLNTLPSEKGGTGVANPVGKKITLENSLSVKGAGDFTITTTGASNITFPTTGTMATLEGVEVFTNKTLESPVLTGTPTSPTAILTDNSKTIANTEFVQTRLTNVKADVLSTTLTALDLKEDKSNKSTDIVADANSDTKYPSAKAVKSYIDNNISSNATPDATTISKGKIQLTGDLGGTASLPVVNSVGGVNSSTISLLPSAVNANTISITANTDILNNATANATPNTLVKRDELGNFSANVITATLSGNASTTSRLLNPVSIYGNTFSGTESITAVLAPNFGGTGNDNGLNTIKLGGNLTTASDLSIVGTNSTTIRTEGITDVTLPLTGTLATLSGAETLTNKTVNGVKPEALATGFKISGGTATSTTLTVIGDVTVGGVNTGDQLISLTGDVSGSGTGIINTTINSIGGVSSNTISTLPGLVSTNTSNIAANTQSITANTAVLDNATSANIANTLVKRDANGGFEAGATKFTTIETSGLATLASAQVGSDLTVTGTAKVGTLSSTKAVFTDANQNLTSNGILGVDQGGTGSTTKNFVDLTSDQTVAGNKTLSGATTLASARVNNDLLVAGNTNTGTLSSTITDAGTLTAGTTTLGGTTVNGNLSATNTVSAATLSATTTNAGELTAGTTRLGGATVNSDLAVLGNTNTGSLSSTITDAGTLTAGNTNLGQTRVAGTLTAGATTLASARVNGSLEVLGNTSTGSLTSTVTEAGELTAGNASIRGTLGVTGSTTVGNLSATVVDVNGNLTAGATTLSSATITSIAGNTDMSNAKIVLTDKNNTLTTIDVLDVAHGGTGTSTLGNFVDLTSDQTITGNKTFIGNTKAGNLSATTVDVNGNLTAGATKVKTIETSGLATLNSAQVANDLAVAGNGTINNLTATNTVSTATLSASTTNAGVLTAGTTRLGGTTVNSDLAVTGNTNTRTLSSTITDAGRLTAGVTSLGTTDVNGNLFVTNTVSANTLSATNTNAGVLTAGATILGGTTITGATVTGDLAVGGNTSLTGTLGAGATTLASARVNSDLVVGNTVSANTLSATNTNAGVLTAGATRLSSATITSIAGNTDMSNAKIVLTDKNNTLTTIDVLDIAHGGTGTNTLGNFVDLTSDQTITGNKTFTGNTKAGNLSATTVDVNGNLTAGATTLLSAQVTSLVSAATLSATTTNAGELIAGTTRLGGTTIADATVNNSLEVKGATNLTTLGTSGLATLNTAQVNTNLLVIGNTNTGSISSTITDAGTLTAGNTNLGQTRVAGTLSAGETTLTNATITGISSMTTSELQASKLVLADGNNTLRSLDVLDIAHGGTGTSTLSNFVDLTSDQTITGNKTFTGNTKAGNLTAGATTLLSAQVTGLVSAATLSATNTNAGVLTAGATSVTTIGTSGLATLASAQVNSDLVVTGNTNTKTLSSTDASVANALVVNGNTVLNTLTTNGTATIANATIGGSLEVSGVTNLRNGLVVTGNTNTGSLTSTVTEAGELTAGNASIRGTLGVAGSTTVGNLSATVVDVNGNLTAGATTLASAKVTGIAPIAMSDLSTSKIVLTDASKTLTTIDVLDVAHGGTGTSTLSNFVDLTSDQTITGNKTFIGNTKAGNLTAGATTLLSAQVTSLVSAATLSATTTNAGELTAGTTRLGGTTVNSDLAVTGNTNTGSISSTITDAGTLTAGNTNLGQTRVAGTLTAGATTLASARVNGSLEVLGNTNTGSLTSTVTEAGELTAGNASIRGTLGVTGSTTVGNLSATVVDVNGNLTAGATTLASAKVTGIAPIAMSDLSTSKIVLTDASKTLTTIDVLDVAHGGTGTSTLSNFVDLTSDQTITGNKTFTGNTKAGNLSATTVDVNGNLTAGATTLASAQVTNNLVVLGNTRTGSLSSTITDAGRLTAGVTSLGTTDVNGNLFVTNTVSANTLSASTTNAGVLTAGTTTLGSATVNGTLGAGATTLNSAQVTNGLVVNGVTSLKNTDVAGNLAATGVVSAATLSATNTNAGVLTAGATSLASAQVGSDLAVVGNTNTGTLSVTGKATIASLENNGVVLTDGNKGLITIGVLDVAHGGTGTSTLGNFVDLTSDQMITGNKTFTGNTKAGNLTAGATTLLSAQVTGLVSAATLSATTTNAGELTAGTTRLGGTTVNSDLAVLGNTNTGTLSSTITDAGTLTAGNTTLGGTTVNGNLSATNTVSAATLSATATNAGELTAGTTRLGSTSVTTIGTSGLATLASAQVNTNLLVTGNTNTGSLTSTVTEAGELTAGNASIRGTLGVTGSTTVGNLSATVVDVNGNLTAGATTLASAKVTGIAPIAMSDLSTSKIVLTDKNNTLTTIDVIDVAHGGTGTSTLGNFVDLTSDQTITGNKTFTGNTIAGNLTAGATTLASAQVTGLVSAATLSATTTNAGELTAGTTRLGGTTVNSDLVVTGNTNTRTLSSTDASVANALAVNGNTVLNTLTTNGTATIANATIGGSLEVSGVTNLRNGLVVTGNTNTGSLSSTVTDAGTLTAGETTLTNATITGISSITSLTGSKLVLADANNTLRSLDILDEEHGGTGSKIKNFVDLTTDQIVNGNKSFTGNTKVGTLSTTLDASIGRDLKVNGKTSLGETTVTSINKVAFVAPLNNATLNIADGKTLNVSNDATISGSNSGDQSISITGDINATASTGILNATIGVGKVVNNHLANATITGAKIAANTVGTTNIANLAVSAAKISNNTITNAKISLTAAIADTKLATISSAGKVANSATTASSLKSNNTIVARDANGAFAATLITSDLIGNVTGDITGNAENVRAVVLSEHGGTGVNNAGKKIILGGDITTASDITFSGTNSTTIATQGVTNVILPINGTLATLSEKETLKNKTIDNAELTGITIAPTAAIGTATQQVATTAFVMNSVNTSTTSAVNSITSDLALKEDVINKIKSADFLNNIDDTKYPTTLAVKEFVLSGDLIGLNGVPSVNKVGGYSAAVISSVTSNVLSATSDLVNGQLVTRDASGNFSANMISATLNGNATNVNGIVLGENGGTGKSNRGKTIELGGNILTFGDVTFAGTNSSTNSTTILTDGNTTVTLPLTGTLATLNGIETLTNKILDKPILTVSPDAGDKTTKVATTEFVMNSISTSTNSTVSSITSDLTKKEDITNRVSSANFTSTLTDDKYPTTLAVNEFVLSGDLISDVNGLPKVNTVGGVNSTVISKVVSNVLSATANNENSQLVQRDPNGNFSAGIISANVIGNLTGNVTGNLDGNAKTATNLQIPVSIYGNTFSGTESITTVIAPNFGGTGVDNGDKKIQLGGNIITAGNFIISGTSSATAHDLNLIVSDNTSVILPSSGTIATLAGTELLTNKTIDFSTLTTNTKAVTQSNNDKSDNIATTAFVQTLVSGAISSTVSNVSLDLTKKEDISNRVISSNFTSTLTDDKYPTTKAVNDFVLSGDLVGDINGKPSVNKVGGATAFEIATVTAEVLAATASNTAGQIVKRDALGNFEAGTISAKLIGDVTGSLFGNATSATQFLTGRKIYGNTFNGTQDLAQVIGTEFGGTGVSTATANYVFAGPESGSNAAPGFRKLVAADLPAGSGNYIANGLDQQSNANFNISGSGVIGTSLTAGTISTTGNTNIGGNLDIAGNSIIAGNTTLNGSLTVKGKTLAVNNDATISGSNTGDQSISIVGDITANASTGVLSATINNESVSYAKIQKVTAARLLGNPSAGLSSISEIEVGSGLNLSTDGKLTASGLGGTVTNVSFNVNDLGTDIAGAITLSSTTPQITLSVPSASASSRGLITAADWNTFNKKQNELIKGSGIDLNGSTISVTGLTTTNIDNNAGITNAQLAKSTIQIGGTTIALGETTNTLTGLTVVSATNFTGSLLGNASTATKLFAPVSIYGNLFDGTSSLNQIITTANGGTGVSTATANYVFAGPESGSNAAPGFRKLVAADLPAGSGNYIANGLDQQANANFNISGSGVIGTSLTAGTISATGNTNVGGNLEIVGNSTITGNTILNGSLTVKGKTLAVNNDATISGSNTGDQSISIVGDITANASTGILSATINNGSITTNKILNENVTFEKIQNINAGKLLGNKNNGLASVGEITVGNGLNLSNDGTLTASGLGGTVTNIDFNVDNIGTDIAGTVTLSSTTPQIRLSVPSASSSSRGLITSADWNTFNNKQNELIKGSGIDLVGSTISVTGLTTTNIAANAGITNAQLAKSTIQLGSSVLDLGASTNSIAGLYSVTANDFIGSLTGNASTATQLATGRKIYGNSFNGTTDLDQVISPEFGGTGVNNTGKTITLGGNILTAGSLAFVGTNSTTFRTSGNTELDLPTSGTLATTEGTEALKNKTINGLTPTSLSNGFSIAGGVNSKTLTVLENTTLKGDNTGDQTITLTGDVTGSGTGTFSTTISNGAINNIKLADASINDRTLAGNISDSKLATITSQGKVSNSATTATSVNTLNTIVSRDANGNFDAGIITASLAGNASTTTQLLNARNIYGASFNGTADVTSVIAPIYGGTGINNGNKTITLGGNISTEGELKLTGSNSLNIATIGTTNITLPTTGTIATLAGTETMTNKTIVDAILTGIPTAPTILEGGNDLQIANKAYVTSSIASVTGAAVNNLSNSTQSALSDKEDKVNKVKTVITKDATFTDLQYPTVNSIRSYVDLTVGGSVTPEATTTEFGKIKLAGDLGGIAAAPVVNTVGGVSSITISNIVSKVQAASSANDANSLVLRDQNKNFSANMITADLTGNVTGNANTATKLFTPVSIYGNQFDGTISLNQIIGTNFGGTGVSSATANYVFAGPESGSSAAPGFRKLVAADLPAGSGSYIANGRIQQADANFNISGSGVIGTSLMAGTISSTGNTSVGGDLTIAGSTTLNGSLTVNGKLVEVTNNTSISGSNTGDQSISIAGGEITANASTGVLSATINNGAITTSKLSNANVTYEKIQNVGAGKLLGNKNTIDATVGEISIGSGLNLSTDGKLSATGLGGTVTNVSFNVNDLGTDIGGAVTFSNTTPQITLSVPSATATSRGLITSTDWTKFNNKQNTISFSTNGDNGSASFDGTTLNIPTYTLAGLGGIAKKTAINAGTKKLVSFDADGLVTAGFDATTDNITASGDKLYVTAAQSGILSNTSGVNTGDQTISINGEITASGSKGELNAIINNGAVTYAKLQNVKASTLLGNPTGSDTKTSEIFLGTGLSFNGQTLNSTGGTITEVKPLTITNTGNDISSSVSNATTVPVLTLNIPVASSNANKGLLSNTDYDKFTAKQEALTTTQLGVLSNTTGVNSGDQTISITGDITANASTGILSATINNESVTYAKIQKVTAARLLGNPTAGDANISEISIGSGLSLGSNGVLTASGSGGTVRNVSFDVTNTGTSIIGSVTNSSTTPQINLNIPLANLSGTNAGLLSNTDWNIFNNKQNTISVTKTGDSGPASFDGTTLNIPNYTLAGLGGIAKKTAITAGTKQLVSFDTDGLVTGGFAPTTNDITAVGDKLYVTAAQSGVLSNTSGVNTGDQTISITGDITAAGTKDVLSATINNGSIKTAKIADNAVTLSKIEQLGGKVLLGNALAGNANASQIALGSGITFDSEGKLSATGTGGTVTSLNPITINASGNTFSSSVINASTTPTLGLTIPLASESGTIAGLLSNADYALFSGKQNTLTNGSGINISGNSVSVVGITNTNIAEDAAIKNTQLASSSMQIGNTTIALGATTNSLSGLASVTATNFTGQLTGNATNVTGIVAGANGGTGVNNGSNTITIGGNIHTAASFTTTGSALKINTLGLTDITVPATGTMATLAGVEELSNKTLVSPILTGSPTAPTPTTGDNSTKIATTAFVNSAMSSTVTDATTLSKGVIKLAGDLGGTADVPVVIKVGGVTAPQIATAVLNIEGATPANTASKVVSRDASGNFSAGTITANLTGNATNVTGIVAPANGGTGIANTNTITLGGNISTASSLTTVGAYSLTFRTTANTDITLPTSGTIATLASPVFTGSPMAPTVASGNSSDLIATTAFVTNAISTVNSSTSTSLAAKQDAIQEVTDELTATSTQTSFTLTQTPSARSKVKMYINGIRISNTAYSLNGLTITYTASSNGNYAIQANDRIQFDYFY